VLGLFIIAGSLASGERGSSTVDPDHRPFMRPAAVLAFLVPGYGGVGEKTAMPCSTFLLSQITSKMLPEKH
jgi:hypothetical protein